MELYYGWREVGHLSMSLIIPGLHSLTYSINGTSVTVITVNEIPSPELFTGHFDLSHYIFSAYAEKPENTLCRMNTTTAEESTGGIAFREIIKWFSSGECTSNQKS